MNNWEAKFYKLYKNLLYCRRKMVNNELCHVQNTFICIVHYSRVQFFKDCIKLYSILTNNRVLS